jgi:hypothetical protein
MKNSLLDLVCDVFPFDYAISEFFSKFGGWPRCLVHDWVLLPLMNVSHQFLVSLQRHSQIQKGFVSSWFLPPAHCFGLVVTPVQHRLRFPLGFSLDQFFRSNSVWHQQISSRKFCRVRSGFTSSTAHVARSVFPSCCSSRVPRALCRSQSPARCTLHLF